MIRIKYIVSDVDGVILNRMPVYGEVFSLLLSQYFGIDENYSKDKYFKSAGTSIDKQFILVLEGSGKSHDEVLVKKLVDEFFEINSDKEAPFFPGSIEIFQRFSRDGLGLFATTGSNTDEVKEIFLRNGLYFNIVLGSDKIKKGPEHIKIFANSVGESLEKFSSQAIYIGDGPRDMEIAKECGLGAIGILTSPGLSKDDLFSAGADHVIYDIITFPKFVL